MEIRIANKTDFDPSQVVSITIYHDARNHYHSANPMKEIKRAMGDAVVHFGNNFRHLIYDVRVLPGEEMDGVMASIDRNPNIRRRRRRARKS